MATDWKPDKRIRDQEAVILKVMSDPVCRICKNPATEGHHSLLRSQGGDDVAECIVPLCLHCHRHYHDGKGQIILTASETLYLRGKLKGRAEAYAEKRRLVLR